MNYRKNSLTRVFIQRVSIIFIFVLLLVAIFYRWIFPTYYYWKMEQPVKEAQKLIQNGQKTQLATDLVVIAVDNKLSASEEELTSEMTLRLNKEAISLNRFWVDKTTLQAAKKGNLFNVSITKIGKKMIFILFSLLRGRLSI